MLLQFSRTIIITTSQLRHLVRFLKMCSSHLHQEEEEEEDEDEETEEEAIERMKNDIEEIYDTDTNRVAAIQVGVVATLP